MLYYADMTILPLVSICNNNLVIRDESGYMKFLFLFVILSWDELG